MLLWHLLTNMKGVGLEIESLVALIKLLWHKLVKNESANHRAGYECASLTYVCRNYHVER